MFNVQIKPRNRANEAATVYDVVCYDVFVYRNGHKNPHDQLLGLPCVRSAQLLATFFCARHRCNDFDLTYKPRITLENGRSVPIADDGSFA